MYFHKDDSTYTKCAVKSTRVKIIKSLFLGFIELRQKVQEDNGDVDMQRVGNFFLLNANPFESTDGGGTVDYFQLWFQLDGLERFKNHSKIR